MEFNDNRTRLVRAIVTVAATLVSTAVMAQSSPERLKRNTADAWKLAIGLGVSSEPRYPGSDERKTRALPMISANYERYFIGSVRGSGVLAGLGVYLYQDDHWDVGVELGSNLEKPRKESDSSRLRGVGDVDATALGSVFASYSNKWFAVRGNVVTDVGGKHQGTRASLGIEGKYSPADGLVLWAGPSLTWADSKYTQALFGINAGQSTNSGLPTYTPASGMNSVRLTVGADYRLARNWELGARYTAEDLRGDAINSPITQKRAQNSASVFAAYSF